MPYRVLAASVERLRNVRLHLALIGFLFLAAPVVQAAPAATRVETTASQQAVVSNEQLAQSLPGGFVSRTQEVNGVRLHYVIGGQGKPLYLLPGWPQTWWQFNKIMPELAKTHQVIAVDLRGMGGSDKPLAGYDKKTMAADIHALAAALGHDRVDIAGHDIGAMVAYAFAANYPSQVNKIALIDVAHPDESLYDLTLLPPAGQPAVGSGNAEYPVFLWWFALNQIPDLPEAMLIGRMRLLIDWLFDTQLKDPSAISAKDREIYAAAYSSADAIRAGNAWYQTFRQDIEDQKHYGPIDPPLLMLAGERNYPFLKTIMPLRGKNVQVVKVSGASHYVPEDQPAATVSALKAFFRP